MEIVYDKVSMPVGHTDYVPVNRTRETMEEHQQKVLEKMKENRTMITDEKRQHM